MRRFLSRSVPIAVAAVCEAPPGLLTAADLPVLAPNLA